MKKGSFIIAFIIGVIVLNCIQTEWAYNLHLFLTIIITPLFIYVGSASQKSIKSKTAKNPQEGMTLTIITTTLFGSNLILCVVFGLWFQVICWGLLTLVWISTSLEKHKYIKYFEKKGTEEACESKATS